MGIEMLICLIGIESFRNRSRMSEEFKDTLAWLFYLHGEGEIDEEGFIILTTALLHEEVQLDGFVDLHFGEGWI
jgi:hypothetical protein